jgi:hypothetical protein
MEIEQWPRENCLADLFPAPDGGLKCSNPECTHSVRPGVKGADRVGCWGQGVAAQLISAKKINGGPERESNRSSFDGGPSCSSDWVRFETEVPRAAVRFNFLRLIGGETVADLSDSICSASSEHAPEISGVWYGERTPLSTAEGRRGLAGGRYFCCAILQNELRRSAWQAESNSGCDLARRQCLI